MQCLFSLKSLLFSFVFGWVTEPESSLVTFLKVTLRVGGTDLNTLPTCDWWPEIQSCLEPLINTARILFSFISALETKTWFYCFRNQLLLQSSTIASLIACHNGWWQFGLICSAIFFKLTSHYSSFQGFINSLIVPSVCWPKKESVDESDPPFLSIEGIEMCHSVSCQIVTEKRWFPCPRGYFIQGETAWKYLLNKTDQLCYFFLFFLRFLDDISFKVYPNKGLKLDPTVTRDCIVLILLKNYNNHLYPLSVFVSFNIYGV